MGLADRLAAAKREREGGDEPTPAAAPTTTVASGPSVGPVLDITGEQPVIDLTDPAPAAEGDDAVEVILEDGFSTTDPNAVLSWRWDEGFDPSTGAPSPAKHADEDDDLDLPDNDSWARRYREQRHS